MIATTAAAAVDRCLLLLLLVPHGGMMMTSHTEPVIRLPYKDPSAESNIFQTITF